MISGYRGRAVGFAKWAAAIATVVAVWSVTDAPSTRRLRNVYEVSETRVTRFPAVLSR